MNKEIIKSFSSSCKSCGIISCKYVGIWDTDHWIDEELIEEHNENCELLIKENKNNGGKYNKNI
jgi:hypothetical protein